MQSTSAFTVLAIALAALGASTTPNAAGQSATLAFHVEFNTLPGCYRNGCNTLFSDFGDKDISVLRNGGRYPVYVTRGDDSSFPTHLLVVFAEGAARPPIPELAGRLQEPLNKGWLVSAARPDGSFTPYCNKHTFKQALDEPSPAPSNDNVKGSALIRAVETLEGFPGRRVLLVISAPRENLPNWVAAAAAELAPVYIVDGGERRRDFYQTTDWGAPNNWRGEVGARENPPVEPEPRVCNWKMVTARQFDHGIMHEVRLPSAIKDMIGDSRYDYDLSFSIPASDLGNPATSLHTGVEMTTRKNVTVSAFPIAIPDSATVDLYAVRSMSGRGPSPQTRISLPGDLSVTWRCSFGQNPSVLFRLGQDRPQVVLPRAAEPHGTVLVPYSPAKDLRTAEDTGPRLLRIESPDLLGWDAKYICE